MNKKKLLKLFEEEIIVVERKDKALALFVKDKFLYNDGFICLEFYEDDLKAKIEIDNKYTIEKIYKTCYSTNNINKLLEKNCLIQIWSRDNEKIDKLQKVDNSYTYYNKRLMMIDHCKEILLLYDQFKLKNIDFVQITKELHDLYIILSFMIKDEILNDRLNKFIEKIDRKD